MDSLDSRILNVLGKFFKRFKTRNVLKTMEEVEANTNEENLPSAVVVGELINNLGHGQISFEVIDGEPYVKVGADSPRPFRKSKLVYTNVWWSFACDGKTVTRTLDFSGINGYDKLSADNILFDIISFSSGYSGACSTVTNKSYNSKTGILTCSVHTTADPFDGVTHAHFNSQLNFNVYII